MQKQPINLRNEIIFGCFVLLAFSFFSRALLSISIILFAIASITNKDLLQQVKRFFSTSFLLAISLLFFIPFISGLWSSNTQAWLDICRIKLPLLVLPLAFAGNWHWEEKRWKQLAAVFVLLVTGASFWSFFHYLQNMQAIHAGYLKSKTIVTPLEDDHVRFSWLVSTAVLFCLLLAELYQRTYRPLFLIITAWFIIYLHLLAARTGLLCLYVLLLLYAIYLLYRYKNRKPAFISIIFIFALPILSWFLLPTFQNRIRYICYDVSNSLAGHYVPGANDGNRILSLKAGWSMIQHHPFGVGAGDVFDASKKWYAQNVSGMLSSDQLNPNSEWLYYGCIAGWIGILLFTAILSIPFFVKTKYRFYWLAFNIIAALSFVFDVGLEVQYGVFLYAFILLWLWKWLNQKEMTNE